MLHRFIFTLNATLWRARFEDLHVLEEFYLSQITQELVRLYSGHATEVGDHAELVHLAALVLLLATVTLSFFLIVQRLVASLDNEVKRTRSLLLMVPDGVLQTLSKLRRFLVKKVVGNTNVSGMGFVEKNSHIILD